MIATTSAIFMATNPKAKNVTAPCSYSPLNELVPPTLIWLRAILPRPQTHPIDYHTVTYIVCEDTSHVAICIGHIVELLVGEQ